MELRSSGADSPRTPMSLAAVAALVGLALAMGACGPTDTPADPPVAVLSAFPAELAPHLARASIDETEVIDGHAFHVGTLEGVRVILAMTGIGLDNATDTTRVLLERFQVSAVVVSGVAGSSELRIGDVAVPEFWVDDSGASFPVAADLAARARSITDEANPTLERCTEPPPLSTAPPGTICLEEAPRIAVGGTGHSSDPFGDSPLPCRDSDDDVFGCDPAVRVASRTESTPPLPIAEDMETAAIARETAARGIPFLAFRAMSDGPGDPLGLPGFPGQFFTYYRLAAVNAAHAVWAFLGAG